MEHPGIKIILCNPPTSDGELVIREGRCEQSGGLWSTVWPPLTLATVAAFLEDRNHIVQLLDCPVQKIDDTAFLAIIDKFQPDLVVLNVSTPTFNHDIAVAKALKSRCRQCITVALGTHVTALPEQTLTAAPDLDIIISGEPELTVVDIAEHIATNADIFHIDGTVTRDKGRIIYNRPRAIYQDVDNLPIPAWHLIDLRNYLLPIYKRPFLMISSGRGCPFDCSFCTAQTYYGKKLRLRSPKSVIREMYSIKRNLGVSDFLFWTETFTVNKAQVLEICELIGQNGFGVRWTCNSRVDVVDLDMLKRMKAAGCWMISFGIESSSNEILKRAGKNIQMTDIHRAVKLAHQAGLQVTGHFILGLPGETETSLNKSARLASSLDLDFAQFYCAAPFPGSRLFEESLEKKWIRNPDWSHFAQTHANLDLPNLPGEVVMKARNRAIRHFYLRPRQIFKIIQRIHTLRELKQILSMSSGFIRDMFRR